MVGILWFCLLGVVWIIESCLHNAGLHGCFSFGGVGRGDGFLSLALREEEKQGLSFTRWLLHPAGTEVFIFFNLGRLRGGRQMGAC
jgi:hypothetical protein